MKQIILILLTAATVFGTDCYYVVTAQPIYIYNKRSPKDINEHVYHVKRDNITFRNNQKYTYETPKGQEIVTIENGVVWLKDMVCP